MSAPARRVLFLSHGAQLGGAEQVLLDLLAHIDRARIHPFLVTLEEGPLCQRARDIGVETSAIGTELHFSRRSGIRDAAHEWRRLVRVVAWLVGFVRDKGVTVVYTNSAKSHICGGLAARLTGRRVVARVHDIVRPPAFGLLARGALAFALSRLADRVLPVSCAAAEPLARFGVRPANLRVVYNGVRMRPKADGAPRIALRRELGLPASSTVLGSVGNLTRWKGQHLLLEALPFLVRHHQDLRALIVGSSLYTTADYSHGLRALASERSLDGVVQFLGFREDARELLGACDVVVHTSVEPDPLPTVLLEALAEGVFVVAADAGGVPEIVDDPSVGVRYRPGDVQALTAVLSEVLTDRRYARRDAAAADRTLAKFSLPGYVRAIDEELADERASANAASATG